MVSGARYGPSGSSDRSSLAPSALLLALALAVSAAPVTADISFDLESCAEGVLDVDVSAPSDGELLTGYAKVEWEVTGSAKDLAEVDLFVNTSSSSKDKVASGMSGGTHEWDTWTYDDVVDATIAVRARIDTCQAHDEVSEIDIDNTPPIVGIEAPSDGDLLTGDASISWSTLETHPATVDIDVSDDGGDSWTDLHDGPDDGRYTWSTDGLLEGDDYRVRIRATDAAGTTGDLASTGSFAIDNEAPDATVTSPTGGAKLDGEATVAWDASDLHLDCVDVQVRPSGGAWSTLETCNTSGETTLDTTSLDDGDHEIRILASDTLGHVDASAAVGFSVDNLDGAIDDGNDLLGREGDDGSTGGTGDDTTSDDTSDAPSSNDAAGGPDEPSAAGDPDPVATVVESFAAAPLPVTIFGIVATAVLIGVGAGLWTGRRKG